MQNLSEESVWRFTEASAAAMRDASFPMGHLTVILRSWHRAVQTEGLFFGEHEHPFFELSFMQRGSMETHCEETTVRCKAENRIALLLPPLLPHSRKFGPEPENINETICLDIQGNDSIGQFCCRELPNLLRQRGYSFRMEPQLLAIIGLYEKNILSNSPDPVLTKMLAGTFLSSLLTSVFPELFLGDYLARIRQDADLQQCHSRVEAIKRLVEYCINVNAPPGFFEKHFGLSIQYLNRLFKAETGMTIHQYRTCRKIESIKEMLLTTRSPISEISRSFGFRTPELFCIFFNKHCDCSPREFRRRNNAFL